ncbi:MAG: heavy-metal-associated domain-containing protein [Chlamydiae bacterium]|nr:heavy-metal-associated domain-containing protein [Chlamydiota bacterium]MBI3276833.1 heavy-metal-associated domain-containing protein [Chlamydiota bacterium]
MRAKGLGFLSALTASVCCLGPLVMILLGLGGLGIGSILGRYHWFFITAAAGLLALAWAKYFKEKKSCESEQCEMGRKRMTRNILILASAVVLTFAGFNIYTYARGKPVRNLSQADTRVSIPVKGMSCFTCEIAIQQAVKKLPGIRNVKASASDGIVLVSYDTEKTSLDEVINAINETGYKAEKLK